MVWTETVSMLLIAEISCLGGAFELFKKSFGRKRFYQRWVKRRKWRETVLLLHIHSWIDAAYLTIRPTKMLDFDWLYKKEGRTVSSHGPIILMVRLNGAISYTSPIGQPRSSRLKDLQWENDTTRVDGSQKLMFPIYYHPVLPLCQKYAQIVVSETTSGKYYLV